MKQCPELEANSYFNVIARYERADLDAFAKLLALCVNGLDQQATHFLGSVFMSLELGEGAWGNFSPHFTLASYERSHHRGSRANNGNKMAISVCASLRVAQVEW
ncbi:hypothetical protein [Providencia hangzhouensis]|uniref:hypothetical protein n=1 Tax=Providencia hangzhouensis TaxID=3031799 RepID=UPI00397BBF70